MDEKNQRALDKPSAQPSSKTPKAPRKAARKGTNSASYDIQTSEEADTIMRAASDGQSGAFWDSSETSLSCVFNVPGLSHYVRLELTADEKSAGLTLEMLNELRRMQNSNTAFALLYISSLMTKAQPTPDNPTTNIFVSLDDIISAIGFDPRSTGQRAEMRRWVWSALKFGEKAQISGERTGTYRDKLTGHEIVTRLETPPWRIVSQEVAEQPSLFPDGEVPLRVELAPSADWLKLWMHPSTAQYLPLGEVLGCIPGAKPSGAWARVIGLSLSNFWRRKLRGTLDGSAQPTRRELLMRYVPSTGSIDEVLNSPNPRRAIEYWAGALSLLADAQFIERIGEAALTYEMMRKALTRQDWGEEWLDGIVDLRPGPAMRETMELMAGHLYASQPQNLKRLSSRNGKRSR